MSEIISDAERKAQVDEIVRLFPSLDCDTVENLLGAVDYDAEQAVAYLFNFTQPQDASLVKLGTEMSAIASPTPAVSGIQIVEPDNPVRGNSAREGTEHNSSQKNLLSPDADNDAAVSDDDDVTIREFLTPTFGDNADSDIERPPSEGVCINEVYAPRKLSRSRGKPTIGIRPAASASAMTKQPTATSLAPKKHSVPSILSARAAANSSRQSIHSARNQKTDATGGAKLQLDLPMVVGSRPPTRLSPRFDAKQLFASHDGIRGHLAVTQRADNQKGEQQRDGYVAISHSVHTPVAQKHADGQGNAQAQGALASTRLSYAKLHLIDVNLPSRYSHDQKAGVSSRAPQNTQTKAPVVHAKALPKPAPGTVVAGAPSRAAAKNVQPPAASALVGKHVEPQLNRSFLKHNAAPTPRPNAESKSNDDQKSEQQIAKVIDDYERAQVKQPDVEPAAAQTQRPASASSKKSPAQQETAGNDQQVQAAQTNVDLGDLVIKAVQRGASLELESNAAVKDSLLEQPRAPVTPHRESLAHTFELAGTDSPIKYKRGKLLGRGAYGRVYLAFTDKGQLIAVKEIEIAQSLTQRHSGVRRLDRNHNHNQAENEANGSSLEAAQRYFEREFRAVARETHILSQIHHPNVVKFLGVYRQFDVPCGESFICKIYIFIDYIAGDTIANLLRQFGAFAEPVTRHYVAQILSGVTFLHSHNIIHRDIKGQNIMVDKRGNVQLIDFGSAKMLVQSATDAGDETERGSSQASLNWDERLRPDSNRQQGTPGSQGTSSRQQSLIGSPYWMAPEVIRQEGHSFKSDCWSLGCTVFEMATGSPPWFKLSPLAAMWHIANDNDTPFLRDYASEYSEIAEEFVTHCMDRSVEKRFTALQLLESSFLSS